MLDDSGSSATTKQGEIAGIFSQFYVKIYVRHLTLVSGTRFREEDVMLRGNRFMNRLLMKAFNAGKLCKSMQRGFLHLIRKFPNAENVGAATDYRPTACCNRVNKLGAKIITKRMQASPASEAGSSMDSSPNDEDLTFLIIEPIAICVFDNNVTNLNELSLNHSCKYVTYLHEDHQTI